MWNTEPYCSRHIWCTNLVPQCKKSKTNYLFPAIQFSFSLKREESIGPEVVIISHFDTRCGHEELCVWHTHLAASQGRVLTVNIYKYTVVLGLCHYYGHLLHCIQQLFIQSSVSFPSTSHICLFLIVSGGTGIGWGLKIMEPSVGWTIDYILGGWMCLICLTVRDYSLFKSHCL